MKITFSDIIAFLTSTEIQAKLFSLKVAFLTVSAFFILFIVFAALTTHYLEWRFYRSAWEFFSKRPFRAKRIDRQWNKILKRLEAAEESEYKLAVIEADNMMEASLKRMGYGGENLEERLDKLTPATLSNLEEVRRAHQIRNNIVYDPDYRLSLEETKNVLDIYGQAFRDLQILE